MDFSGLLICNPRPRRYCFPAGAAVKTLPANAGDAVQSLGQEDPLEEETAAHSSVLAWAGEPGGLQSMGLKDSDTAEQLNNKHLSQMSATQRERTPTAEGSS